MGNAIRGHVKARDAINRRLYNNQSFVETAIYRVFVIYNIRCLSTSFSQPPNRQSTIRNCDRYPATTTKQTQTRTQNPSNPCRPSICR
ncbi:hypothetical protein [Tolypothrix sp. NIES-4075]|uniref:hypothetical protein n=1 Tax=Tolypothrix sp. NIES-4075 TaxID=2005459 RepID=UPI00352F9396